MRINLGTVLFAMRDPKGALAELDKAIELDPRNGGAYAARADIFRANGDRKAALADYREALRLAPPDWRPRAQLENFLRECKE